LKKNIPQDLLDITKCPDCGKVQKKVRKVAGDTCENEDCESTVDPYVTREGETVLIWQNPNWDG
jgi:hypothetical protein